MYLLKTQKKLIQVLCTAEGFQGASLRLARSQSPLLTKVWLCHTECMKDK